MAKQAAEKQTHWTEDHARSVLKAWRESGQSGAAFARSIGVVAQRLFWWRKRLARRAARKAAATKAPSFVPVAVRTADPIALSASIVVTVGSGGVRIEVRDLDDATAAWVATMVGALSEARA